MDKYKKKSTINPWLAAGAVLLILLLIAWLTVAMFTGDTDVNADAIVYPAVRGAAMLGGLW